MIDNFVNINAEAREDGSIYIRQIKLDVTSFEQSLIIKDLISPYVNVEDLIKQKFESELPKMLSSYVKQFMTMHERTNQRGDTEYVMEVRLMTDNERNEYDKTVMNLENSLRSKEKTIKSMKNVIANSSLLTRIKYLFYPKSLNDLMETK